MQEKQTGSEERERWREKRASKREAERRRERKGEKERRRHGEGERESERRGGRRRVKAECTSEGESATASDGFELGKVQRLKRDTPHPLHPFESTPPSFTLPPSSRPFLASPRLLSPPVGQLHPPPHHDSLSSPPPSLPSHKTSRASQRARHPPRVSASILSLSHTNTRVYIPFSPLLLSAPSSLSLTEHLRHNTTMWPCVDTTTIQRRYRRERPLVALHRANDTKGITLLVPFGIQKKRCLTRYPNIYPPNPSTFFACSSHAFPARRNSFAHFLVPIQIHDYRLVIISNGSRVT